MNLSIAKGLVVENDSNGYYRSPYYILPTQSSDSYTSGTYGKYLFLPYAQGIIVPEEVSTDETATGDITYDVFLSTSDSAFAKQDVSNLAYESGTATSLGLPEPSFYLWSGEETSSYHAY